MGVVGGCWSIRIDLSTSSSNSSITQWRKKRMTRRTLTMLIMGQMDKMKGGKVSLLGTLSAFGDLIKRKTTYFLYKIKFIWDFWPVL
jgi:hypothetical protein